MAVADPTTDIFARPQRLVDIGHGRKINVHSFGWGSPTVVFSPGVAGRTLHWRYVQPAIARHARTASYDRAGCGFSDPGPLPRLTSGHVSDLRAALSQAKIGPPYVLVGSSAGGHDVRLFAFEHPEEVIGMVLVDPGLDHQNHRPSGRQYAPLWENQVRLMRGWLAHGPPSEGSAEYEACVGWSDPHVSAAMNAELKSWLLRPSTWEAMIAEYETLWMASSDELVASRRHLGDMPLTVLTAPAAEVPESPMELAGTDRRSAAAADRSAGIADLVSLSTRGVHRHVPDSGHIIQYDRPHAVIGAILEVLETARQ